ncbi:MAG: anaerobic glycerol-3-phosphate dehydrogenase subunit C, partial [Chloroflexi bacterium]|nr:anaerobic glycerol-3-phosphate dehydrogenase subunit C [Chloroflexota bacterium]
RGLAGTEGLEVNSIERLPICVMEPSGRGRRRQFSRAITGQGSYTTLEDTKSRLRGIREEWLHRRVMWLEQFEGNIRAYPGVGLMSAHDAREAAAYIQRVAGNTRNIVMNRSSAIANELKPHLERGGFLVHQPYYAESEPFENQARDYWDLPNLAASGLVGDFEVTPAPLRSAVTSQSEAFARDCIAVLGVNAASAEDGSMYFLQHFSNISKSLDQASQVIIVVPLERVVGNNNDAVFQTKCMGIFGLETMLLNLRSRQPSTHGMDALPLSRGTDTRRIHVLLLDNGRSGLLNTPFEKLLLCIGCKACARQCPINGHQTASGEVWSPRDYLFTFLIGETQSTDTCLHCEACRVECPLSIDIPGLMWKAQAERATSHRRTLGERLLGDMETMAKAGSLFAPISGLLTRNEPSRTLVSMMLGMDRDRRLPEFHRQGLKGWFARKTTAHNASGSGRKVAYFTGCFANYCEPELGKALVTILERNGVTVVVPHQKCCGMPMMANKNVSGARRNAQYNVAHLAQIAADGYEIVTACPSCSLMIRREYPSLLDSDQARSVSQHVHYVDEYLMSMHRKGILNTDLAGISESILYHVPCHLKVQDTVEDSLSLLALIPGLRTVKVSTACCGMGGFHGHKKAHSRLSMEIGGGLFQDVMAAHADRVVTGCAACKLQVEAGSHARVTHPVILIEEAYAGRHDAR